MTRPQTAFIILAKRVCLYSPAAVYCTVTTFPLVLHLSWVELIVFAACSLVVVTESRPKVRATAVKSSEARLQLTGTLRTECCLLRWTLAQLHSLQLLCYASHGFSNYVCSFQSFLSIVSGHSLSRDILGVSCSGLRCFQNAESSSCKPGVKYVSRYSHFDHQ